MIRWGIIGCGNVCEVKSGPGFQRAEGSSLVAVMRRDAKAAEDFARRHGVPRWYDSAAQLVADPEVDAVYVASSVDNHEASAWLAAAHRKPCYVEKPMARNHAECLRMIATFSAAETPLFVAYYRRALPRFLLARELIQTGRLGVITGVRYAYADSRHHSGPQTGWRVDARRSGGGIILDLGSHALDIIAYMTGEITRVAGQACNRAGEVMVEDSVAMSGLAGGAPFSATWNFAAFRGEDVIRITGTEGTLELSVFGDEPVRFSGAGGDEAFLRPNPSPLQQPLIQTIVDQLHGKGECPSTGITAARTSLILDRILESYYGGREDGFWSRGETWPGRRATGSGGL